MSRNHRTARSAQGPAPARPSTARDLPSRAVIRGALAGRAG
ncbi:hypothetical protein [Kitasatospora sp. NPDC047058]